MLACKCLVKVEFKTETERERERERVRKITGFFPTFISILLCFFFDTTGIVRLSRQESTNQNKFNAYLLYIFNVHHYRTGKVDTRVARDQRRI